MAVARRSRASACCSCIRGCSRRRMEPRARSAHGPPEHSSWITRATACRSCSRRSAPSSRRRGRSPSSWSTSCATRVQRTLEPCDTATAPLASAPSDDVAVVIASAICATIARGFPTMSSSISCDGTGSGGGYDGDRAHGARRARARRARAAECAGDRGAAALRRARARERRASRTCSIAAPSSERRRADSGGVRRRSVRRCARAGDRARRVRTQPP